MPEESKKTLKEVAEQIDTSKLKPDTEQVEEIMGESKGQLKASRSGKTYNFIPVSLSQIPEITMLVSDITGVFSDASEGNKTDQDILTPEMMSNMAKIIAMGVREEMTEEQALEEFSLGDFPKCFELTLDLNDFLVGMRNIMANKEKSA